MKHHEVRAHLLWRLSPCAAEAVENSLCDPLLCSRCLLVRLQLCAVACVACRPVEGTVYPTGQRQRRGPIVTFFRHSDDWLKALLAHCVVVKLLQLLAIRDGLWRHRQSLPPRPSAL